MPEDVGIYGHKIFDLILTETPLILTLNEHTKKFEKIIQNHSFTSQSL